MDSGSAAPGAARNEKGRNELAWEPDYIAIPYAIFTDRDLSHGAKLLFGRLKLYAGKDGKAFPTHETLARELCVSDRRVRTLLTELKALNRIGWRRTRGSCQFEIKPPGDWKKTSDLDRKETSDLTGRKLPIKTGRKLPTEKKYRKSSSENKKRKQSSPELSGGTHEEPPLPLKADDETPKPPRERLTNPRAEFVARLQERHGAAIDASEIADVVTIELGNRDLSWSDAFLEFEAHATTNPAGLENPPGHYRRLPKKFANKRDKAVIEQEMALRAPLEIKTGTPCRCRGSGLVNFEPGKYCACKTGADLKRIEERSARDREKADSAALSKTS